MSNAKEFFDNARQPEQPMGAIEATAEGIKGAVSAFLAGAGEVWDAAKPMFDHGRTEAAAALFSGNAHVMYMRGTQGVEQGQDQATDQQALPVEPLQQPEVQPEQDKGMGM